jgi:two-component system nitrogen regulation response regulator GlnG/two-component system response regulator HydG
VVVSDTTTMDSNRRGRARGADEPERALVLVVVACTAQPARVGEVIAVDESWGDELRVFGRGEARDDDGAARALLARQRPGATTEVGPLEDGYVSRKQLRVGWHVDGVRVENIGRLGVTVGDQKVTRAVVRPGELLEIDGQLLLLCAERPRILPALRELRELPPFGGADAYGFVGESVLAWEQRERLAFVGARAGHVLLLGPSGCGKELAAHAIHGRSSRAAKKLVARNAATLPAGLIDAELFGNVANYPNAGMAERPGLIGEADGSTLLLDEIGELPDALQTHLLRVLDEGGEYQRLGDAKRRRSDLRLVAATNRPVDQLKSDLAARFPLRVQLAGLDQRPDDVPLLARFLARRAAAKDPSIGARFFDGWDGERGEPRIALKLSRALVDHRWSTHVRELDAVLWTSLASSKGDTLELTAEVEQQLGANAAKAPASAPAAKVEITADAIRASLAKHAGVKDRVWRELGLPSRFALRRLMQKFAIGGDGDDDAT